MHRVQYLEISFVEMKFAIFLSIFCFNLIHCGILPEIVKDKSEFHACLVSYVRSLNISTTLSEGDTQDDSYDCKQLHGRIQEMIKEIYEDISSNLATNIEDLNEINCIMKSFYSRSLLEINIVLTAAHLTAPNVVKNPLEEVQTKTKNIFTMTAGECLLSENNFVEITKNIGTKMMVDEHELKCIKKQLIRSKLWVDDTQIDEVTEINDLEKTTPETDMATEVINVVKDNLISKLSSTDAQSNEIKSTTSCDLALLEVNDRMKHFEFASLTTDENHCMSDNFSDDDFTSIYEVIVLSKLGKTPEHEERRRDLLRIIIMDSIWNLVECTKMFDFNDLLNIDSLLPEFN